MNLVPLEMGFKMLEQATELFCHNGTKHDYPLIRKLHPTVKLTAKLNDSLVMARLRFAHQKELDFAAARSARNPLPKSLIGKHSLEAWGHRMGHPKADFAGPFDDWTPEMQTYCDQDVDTNAALVLYLLPKMRGWERALNMELQLADYLARQERNGWPFNQDAAKELQGTLAAAREEYAEKLRLHFGSWEKPVKKLFIPKRDNAKMGYVKGVPFQKYKTIHFNPGSRDQIADRLITVYGWKPTLFTESGKPQVDENAVRGLPYPIIPDLLEYLLLDKRLGQLVEGPQAWFKHMTDTRSQGGALTGLVHIHGSCNPGGTVTHRCSHAYPNLGQVPKVGKPWGAECRSLFYIPEGWVQMGADESGLELRCLAHYMGKYDNGDYARIIIEGSREDRTEIHTRNQDILGLPDEPADGRTTTGRDAVKTYFYAYLYGAGDLKLGKILYPGLSEKKQKALGAKARKRFLGGLPALKLLTDELAKSVKNKGYLRLPDGRLAFIRHPHAALNTLLQGAGAVISKQWVVEFSKRMTARFGEQGWSGQWAALGFIHDEIQIAVRPEIREEACRIAVESAQYITEVFNWRCPLDGEAKLGANWKETH
jgi:DNA polymerase I-like protein with 3'-5' exonuclease and polymerase domains